MVESKRGLVDQGVEEDNNLDIFEMITNTIELVMELINKKLLIFKHYQVDVKDFKCPLQWWKNHENMFHTISFYVKQNFSYSQIQIETKIFLSLARILTNLKRCHL